MRERETDNGLSLLSDYLTSDEPLGPIAMDDVYDIGAVRALFDGDNALDEAIVRLAPAFIVGRRGAGKTTFLRSSASADAVTAELQSTDVVSAVARTLVVLRRSFPLLVDETAQVWDFVATCALASVAASPGCGLDRGVIRPSLAFATSGRSAGQQDAVSSLALRYLTQVRLDADAAAASFDTLSDFMAEVSLNGVTMREARATLFAATERAKCIPYVNIDSLEDLTRLPDLLDGSSSGASLGDPRIALALQGLFRHVGNLSSKPRASYRMRTCFPAELWNTLSDHSSNPIKDFRSSILLHWTGAELLHVAAKRLLQGLAINFPDVYRHIRVDRGAARRSWGSSSRVLMHFLPSTVVNDFGTPEPTLSYLLRHTQLLPRHLILLLNNVLKGRNLGDADDLPTSGDVTRAVHDTESTIVETVINAHQSVYQDLEFVCDGLVKELPLVFPMGDLHSVFNRSPVRRRGQPDEISYNHLQRMLLESGALGRKIDQTTYYDSAEFEFHQTHKLIATEEDTVCWHPLFAEKFDCKSRLGRDGTSRPVYPLGAAPAEDADLPRVVHLLADQ